jgi:hypothetical protein
MVAHTICLLPLSHLLFGKHRSFIARTSTRVSLRMSIRQAARQRGVRRSVIELALYEPDSSFR